MLDQQARTWASRTSSFSWGSATTCPGSWPRSTCSSCPPTSREWGARFMDAMASRLPVVATRAGGIPEVVEDRETGPPCPAARSAALARGHPAALPRPRAGAPAGRPRAGGRPPEVSRPKPWPERSPGSTSNSPPKKEFAYDPSTWIEPESLSSSSLRPLLRDEPPARGGPDLHHRQGLRRRFDRLRRGRRLRKSLLQL